MPSPARIVVVGSSNTDLVVFCERLPRPGETVLGGDFQMFGGGKGANQAVAAARAGAKVTFVGAYGADSFGEAAKARLDREGINLGFFQCVPGLPSGVALILVDGVSRDNLIAVARSANDAVDSVLVSSARAAFADADVVISQLEIRDGAVEAVARLTQELGKPFVLNPAPARPLPRGIFTALHTIIVNEHEAEDYAATSDLDEAVDWFHGRGCRNVVITLGPEGAKYSDGHSLRRSPARKVEPVDTTGAGDCFVAWLGVGLGEGRPLEEAVQLAIAASSIKVTRSGAQAGMPTREEVLGIL
jgi:ribokinase